MSADIVRLSDYRRADSDPEIDLATAVDVAIRDLREIRETWGSPAAYARVVECEAMLKQTLASD